jgi:tetratricopeptide (TPR) repeat protein
MRKIINRNIKRGETIVLFFIILSLFGGCTGTDGKTKKEVINLNNEAVSLFAKNPQKALKLLNEAIALDPSYQRAYSNKASLLLKKFNHRKEALNTINILIKIAPKIPEYYVSRAMFFQDKKNKKKIQKDYNKAILLYNEQINKGKNKSYAISQRAYLYFLLGKKKNAMSELNDLLTRNPDDFNAKNVKMLIKNK